MTQAPGSVDGKALRELHIRLREQARPSDSNQPAEARLRRLLPRSNTE